MLGVLLQTERKLEALRYPILLRSSLLRPAAQVRADIFDFVVPHARNRGRQVLCLLRRHAIQHLIRNLEDRTQPIGGKRKETFLLERSEELELHRMEQGAARCSSSSSERSRRK